MRPETGPMRFGKDWCGVFIRGDKAVLFKGLAKALREAIIVDGRSINKMTIRHLVELEKLMESCYQGRSCDGHCDGEQDAGEILGKMAEQKEKLLKRVDEL